MAAVSLLSGCAVGCLAPANRLATRGVCPLESPAGLPNASFACPTSPLKAALLSVLPRASSLSAPARLSTLRGPPWPHRWGAVAVAKQQGPQLDQSALVRYLGGM